MVDLGLMINAYYVNWCKHTGGVNLYCSHDTCQVLVEMPINH